MQRLFAPGCLAVLLAGPMLAGASSPPLATAGSALVASARRAIKATNDEWLPAMRARDAARIVEPYANDALFVLANGDVLRGRSAIRKMYAYGFRKPGRIVSGDLVEDGLTTSGDLVYEWGHARVVFDRDGKAVVSTGRYLTVW